MITRKFHPGSEWLYLKVYTGIKTSDSILQEVIEPLVEQLQTQNLIYQWFFIRYNDPKPHLRIRLNLKNITDHSIILGMINSLFKDYLESGEVSSIIMDTYSRELERYGENTIEYAENLFFKSSQLILNFLEYSDEEKIITSLFYIDQILSAFNLSLEHKIEFAKDSESVFKSEFNADKNLNDQLKKKYNEFYPHYFEFITSEEYEEIRDLIKSNITELTLKPEELSKLESNNVLKIKPKDFFKSIFHMHINRLFISHQRLFEMVVYDHLFRLYKTNRAHSLKK
ncbi:thiopeptide-type bacteriocin biosynthesis protein [Chryseobacterium sp. S0630]|uniref:thiopeptide-type bacteriocin biosynthesis protein n=1 Tax=unclassified Chryseobacterium TaxID=2593645 RepID=UPI000553814C|nr:thiopeptide-type bacteriocin biosynthesis protein [Chryseobacterium sp. S0630]MCP1298218.1 thiopeptide-type bacteriocin biosynthesis protein [Chryseobacterium sp. S0630]